MVPGSYENDKCKNCNSITRLLYPICSGIEDKPFGSEMCNGRGVCDTDPIPKIEMDKSCKYEYNKSVETATINIDNVALNRYSEDSLLFEQFDLAKEKDSKKQCLKYPIFNIPPFGFRILNQDLGTHSFEGSEQKLNKISSDSCDRNSSQEISKRNSQNTPAMSSMRSSMEYNQFFKDLTTINYKDTLKRENREEDVKPIGPFTEPPNPGKQMKLGEPYYVPNRVNKNFYKDF